MAIKSCLCGAVKVEFTPKVPTVPPYCRECSSFAHLAHFKVSS